MSTQPPGGAGSQPPQEPIQPPLGKTPAEPTVDKKDAYLLKSPFAKMFTAHGAKVTAKEIRAIINGILKQQVEEIKKQDAKWKKAMRKLRETLEGQ